MNFNSLELFRRPQHVPVRKRVLQFVISITAAALVVGGLMILIGLAG